MTSIKFNPVSINDPSSPAIVVEVEGDIGKLGAVVPDNVLEIGASEDAFLTGLLHQGNDHLYKPTTHQIGDFLSDQCHLPQMDRLDRFRGNSPASRTTRAAAGNASGKPADSPHRYGPVSEVVCTSLPVETRTEGPNLEQARTRRRGDRTRTSKGIRQLRQ